MKAVTRHNMLQFILFLEELNTETVPLAFVAWMLNEVNAADRRGLKINPVWIRLTFDDFLIAPPPS